jgi:adenosylcobalamin-dependent ribonucleoside-triphosphate reductase
MTVSTRAQVITRRTYNRPLNVEGTVFETWEQTVDRVIGHQRFLWCRAKTAKILDGMPLHDITEDLLEWQFLSRYEEDELLELRQLLIDRKVAVAGRTLWLGGTDVARRREASMFNCSFTNVETVWDAVDVFWLLLQGCGVGFRPISGSLTGFRHYIPELKIIRSKNSTEKGPETNEEDWDPINKVWTLVVGDSAEAWAKSIGKLLAGKYPANCLVLDFSHIRKPGIRLKNYGWLSQGDVGLTTAYTKVYEVLNAKADSLLTEIDILDIINLLGTVLSTRRSAQIAVMDGHNPIIYEFAEAKMGLWDEGSTIKHRSQSNNSIIFWKRPEITELTKWFEMINRGGNGEPGLINGEQMRARAPWAIGMNPCAEILLPNKGFCNLVSIDLLKFKGDALGLLRAAKIIARANYRQTIVDFRDGVLQEAWHLNNEHLRLCGVSLMGVAGRLDMRSYEYRKLERAATSAAMEMADQLGLPTPKNVTSIKPEGTQSKCYDSLEGMHKPLGKYIFNNIAFSRYDPLVETLKAANYNVFNHPYDDSAILVTFPVKNDGVDFAIVDGKEVNEDSAVSQLEVYKLLMDSYCQQNVSCTISYSPEETNEIVNWLYNNWDSYVAVSFLFRNDASKTAADLGYPYLPQEVTTKALYEEYISKLLPIDLEKNNSFEELQGDDCAGGVCPIR